MFENWISTNETSPYCKDNEFRMWKANLMPLDFIRCIVHVKNLAHTLKQEIKPMIIEVHINLSKIVQKVDICINTMETIYPVYYFIENSRVYESIFLNNGNFYKSIKNF